MYLNIVNRLEVEEDCKDEYIFVEVITRFVYTFALSMCSYVPCTYVIILGFLQKGCILNIREVTVKTFVPICCVSVATPVCKLFCIELT